MHKNDNPIFEHNTIEFVTIAVEFCSFVETVENISRWDFVDKATKLLPLLYLKARMLPEIEISEEIQLEIFVTETMYEEIHSEISSMLGEKDAYLETFNPDMPLSDTPVIASIAEDLSDVYQDLGNFCHIFRQGHDEAMREAIAIVQENFRQYWGQKTLNALKALHSIHYNNYDEE